MMRSMYCGLLVVAVIAAVVAADADADEKEKKGGGRAFASDNDYDYTYYKRGGGRAFTSPDADLADAMAKRRAFVSDDDDAMAALTPWKRAGARRFGSSSNVGNYNSYFTYGKRGGGRAFGDGSAVGPVWYKKRAMAKRGGGRRFVSDDTGYGSYYGFGKKKRDAPALDVDEDSTVDAKAKRPRAFQSSEPNYYGSYYGKRSSDDVMQAKAKRPRAFHSDSSYGGFMPTWNRRSDAYAWGWRHKRPGARPFAGRVGSPYASYYVF